jgi:hypothetical protein
LFILGAPPIWRRRIIEHKKVKAVEALHAHLSRFEDTELKNMGFERRVLRVDL